MSTPGIHAALRYLVPTGERPIYIASKGGADAELSISAEFEEHRVAIHDARQLATAASLDREGFALLEQHSCIEDLYNIESAQADYERELRELVLEATVIHNDYTDSSAEKRLRDLLSGKEAEARLQNRYAIVNAWRSIGPPVLQSPLACCDASTIAGADLIASERRTQERIGELELVSWNPDHRWYYYPAMTRDEVLLIKTFDSATDGRARRSIHSAFNNPAAPADAPPRESIESRCLVFF